MKKKSWKTIDIVTDEYEDIIDQAWDEYVNMFIGMSLCDHFSRKVDAIICKTKFGKQLEKYHKIFIACSTLTWRLFQSSSHGKLYVDNEAILAELELFLGQRRLAKEINSSKPGALDDFCNRVRLFIEEARILYYSGIRGKIRKTWEYLQSRRKSKGSNPRNKCQSLLPHLRNGSQDTKSTRSEDEDGDDSEKESCMQFEV